jgi:heat shock protein HtpX
MRRRELFPADRGLQVRMVLAAVLTPLIVVAAVAGAIALLPLKVLGGLFVVTAIGIAAAVRERRRVEHAHLLAPGEQAELQAIVARLCVAADLPQPEIALDDERQPNSWVLDAPGRRPRLHVTTGLLATLDPHELEAVVAHELSHVVNRDATVMTVVGLPGSVLLEGSRGWVGAGGFWPFQFGAVFAALVGRLAGLGSSALSRHRELTADAGAAALTGRPTALASALLKVSGELARLPKADLRAVAARDAFHLVPAGGREDAGGRVAALTHTHPSLQTRIAALERLERRLQQARLGG